MQRYENRWKTPSFLCLFKNETHHVPLQQLTSTQRTGEILEYREE